MNYWMANEPRHFVPNFGICCDVAGTGFVGDVVEKSRSDVDEHRDPKFQSSYLIEPSSKKRSQ
jgi:hypothetical protein